MKAGRACTALKYASCELVRRKRTTPPLIHAVLDFVGVVDARGIQWHECDFVKNMQWSNGCKRSTHMSRNGRTPVA